MSWVKISSTTFAASSSKSGGPDKFFEVVLEYDSAKESVTTRTIRFRANRLKYQNTSYAVNGYYLLVNPGSTSNEKLFTLKAPGKNWDAAVSSSMTISKAYSASNFTIPAFWICCTGSVTPNLTNRTIVYGSYSGSVYNLFKSGGQRENYVTYASNTTSSGTVAGTIPKPDKPVITPTYIITNGIRSDSFSIGATSGKSVSGNEVNSTALYYRVGDSGAFTKASSLTYTGRLTCTDQVKSQTVYAYTAVDGEYNDPISDTASKTIYNYVAPAKPGVPKLTDASFKNNRLTIKQNWTYSWSAATTINNSSPVNGYRIRLYKNGTLITGLTNGSNNAIGKGTSNNAYLDRENTSCTVVINPTAFGFKAGDTVKLGIYAYTRNGNNVQLFSGGGTTEAQVNSVVSTVQNAGVVNVKVNNAWKEGQVYVKVNGAWKEAETINVKAGGAWKESQ